MALSTITWQSGRTIAEIDPGVDQTQYPDDDCRLTSAKSRTRSITVHTTCLLDPPWPQSNRTSEDQEGLQILANLFGEAGSQRLVWLKHRAFRVTHCLCYVVQSLKPTFLPDSKLLSPILRFPRCCRSGDCDEGCAQGRRRDGRGRE